MSQTFCGTDYSWLVLDAKDSVGWFSLNGSGPVPERLCADADGMLEHEVRLVASPTKPVTAADAPSHLRELLVVQLVTADFSQGFVTPRHVDRALSL